MDPDCAEALPFENRAAAGAALARGASGGITVRNDIVDPAISGERFEELAAERRIGVARRETRYRPGMAPLSLAGKTAIVVDDGLATGATMRAALAA